MGQRHGGRGRGVRPLEGRDPGNVAGGGGVGADRHSRHTGQFQREIIVVRGYRKEKIDLPGITCVDNDAFDTTGEIVSLYEGMKARIKSEAGLIVSYGDVIFRKHIIDLLIETEGDLVVAVDTQWHESANRGRTADYAKCSLPYSRQHYNRPVFIEQIAPDIDPAEIDGEWIGFLRISPQVLTEVVKILDVLLSNPLNRSGAIPRLINELIAQGFRVRVVYTGGNWYDVDSIEDVINAGNFS